MKALIGAIIALAGSILAVFDIQVTEEEIQKVAEAATILVGIFMSTFGRPPTSKEITNAAVGCLFACGAAFFLSGCTSLTGPSWPKQADEFVRQIKADEMNLTISSPAFNMNINAKGFDSTQSGTGVVGEKKDGEDTSVE